MKSFLHVITPSGIYLSGTGAYYSQKLKLVKCLSNFNLGAQTQYLS